MRAIFQKLYSGAPEEKLAAFLAVEQALPDMVGLPPSIRDDFVSRGRWVSQFDEWDPEQQRRFIVVTNFVESSALRAGLVLDENGRRVR